jgi:hypothetical protein
LNREIELIFLIEDGLMRILPQTQKRCTNSGSL